MRSKKYSKTHPLLINQNNGIGPKKDKKSYPRKENMFYKEVPASFIYVISEKRKT